jgi:hypothetical protein
MPFVHPILFWIGLAGISIPIVIHILNRRRFKIVDWAAMHFLLDALRKNRRRLRLEELILLALRCLILLLLGFGLARFVGCAAVGSLGVGEGRTIVFVLDDSFSMGQTRGDRTAFTMALEDLRQALEPVTPRDRVAILRTSQPRGDDTTGREVFFPKGSVTDKPALLGQVEALQPSDRRANLAEALQAAAEVFGDDTGQKRLYLFTDLRRVDLAEQEQAANLDDAYAALRDRDVEIIVMDYGRSARRNLTLQAVSLEDRYPLAGRRCDVTVKVRNHGREPAVDIPLVIQATFPEGEGLRQVSLPPETIPRIEPDDVWTQSIHYVPAQAGSTTLTAILPEDELPGDNQACLTLQVRETLKVLIVDGRFAADRPEETGSYFLANALDPQRRGEHGFAVEVIQPADLGAAALGQYDVVCLLNVPNLPLSPRVDPATGETENYPQLAALEQFTARGGGVLLFTGDRVDTSFYNGRFYNQGRGLSPLPIRTPAGDPMNRRSFVYLDPQSIRPEGPMGFFSGDAAALTRLIRFFAYTPADDAGLVSADLTEAPVVEARFDNGNHTPAVVSRRFGRGRVVMFYSTASLHWNDWALDAVDDLTGYYVLFFADLVESLAKPQDEMYNRPLGTDIVYRLTRELRDAVGAIRPPGAGADVVSLRPTEYERFRAMVYPQPTKAGRYALTLRQPDGTERTVLFSRNADPAEGDLRPGGKGELVRIVGDDTFAYILRDQPGPADLAAAAEKKEHWIWAMAALLALLATETYLARKFGHYDA